ncbi:hypothetical protein B296_00006230 [Ensete ventricosum]|uniref:Uncharacterized protein n=1 Tax=Ensete ventricosum TaxID=4639 RepID=A0A427AX44_ENSVE|nr:hypothetical protein B296_00006230 [Ensete ventricosum]
MHAKRSPPSTFRHAVITQFIETDSRHRKRKVAQWYEQASMVLRWSLPSSVSGASFSKVDDCSVRPHTESTTLCQVPLGVAEVTVDVARLFQDADVALELM